MKSLLAICILSACCTSVLAGQCASCGIPTFLKDVPSKSFTYLAPSHSTGELQVVQPPVVKVPSSVPPAPFRPPRSEPIPIPPRKSIFPSN